MDLICSRNVQICQMTDLTMSIISRFDMGYLPKYSPTNTLNGLDIINNAELIIILMLKSKYLNMLKIDPIRGRR